MSVDGISTIRYLTTVSFGFGASALLADVLAELEIARPFVVTDSGVRTAGIADRVVAGSGEPGRATWFDHTPPNPTEAAVLEATEAFRAAGCDGIVSIGGGSSKGLDAVRQRVHPGRRSEVRRQLESEVGRAAMINVA
jgi:4-hydroxybutyrate dehydrogenase